MRSHDIAVFGATGYTGRRIAAALAAAGHTVLHVGRNRAKLAAAAPPEHTAAITGLDNAEEICARVTTVVNAAGSLIHTCEPVARAALAAGAHYVDISGEQQAVRFLFDELHEPALRAGRAVVPSAAFYAALADLLVAAMAAPTGRAETVEIAYHLTGWTPSGAARDNVLRGLGQPILQYDGTLVEVADPRAQVTDFGDPIGRRTTVTYPAPEILTIPRHLDVERVRTVMTTSTFGAPLPARLAAPAVRALGRALRSPAAPLVRRAFTAVTGASATRIDDDPTAFRITAHLTAGGRTTRGVIDAKGIFDITAPIAARIAAATLDPGFTATGALAPAQILPPRDILDGLTAHGLTYRA
ncbi:saccharopine dehydrogenase NADP-binding domain-containing protein [Actinomadura nitritigenes]|uniref:saccharopine dehydrogenase NADP-binding domain-containing protein n=1 Tax=Actinomadura nitritigenes TaxID=134602 RepID=UPI003D908EC0